MFRPNPVPISERIVRLSDWIGIRLGSSQNKLRQRLAKGVQLIVPQSVADFNRKIARDVSDWNGACTRRTAHVGKSDGGSAFKQFSPTSLGQKLGGPPHRASDLFFLFARFHSCSLGGRKTTRTTRLQTREESS